jgi:hypothetical protein
MKLFQSLALGYVRASAFASALAIAPFAAQAQQTCAIPNAQGTAVTYTCNASYTPATPNWLNSFKTWVAANATTGAMACFAPGTYVLPSSLDSANRAIDTDRWVLRGVQNMKICAPTGGAIFEHQSVNASGTPLTTTVEFPSFHIASSSNVSIKGLEFRNLNNYAGVNNPLHHVSWTFLAEDAINTRFFDTKFSGLGKNVVTAGGGSSISLTNATVNCAYHCLASNQWGASVKRSFTVTNSQFTLNHTKDPLDEHGAIYVDSTDITISGSSFNYVTGQGFVAGLGGATDFINLSNVTITGTTAQGRLKMLGWIPLNPNYTNLHINITGSAAQTQIGRPYYCVSYNNPACETGFEKTDPLGSLFRSRPNTSTAYATAPFPPTRTKKILMVNAAMQDAVWMQKAISQNKSYLLTPVVQNWSTMMGGLNGFLDAGDRVLTGDFLVAGQPRVLFFNASTQDGMIMVSALGGSGANGTMTTEAFINWTPALAADFGGWFNANDKILGGDFTGLGRSQLLFMNVDGSGGAFLMAAVDGPSSQLQTLALVPWSAALSTSLAGWMDADDKLVAGDFTGSGRAQLLFINTTGGTQGAASLRQFDNAANAFQIVATVPWNKVVGTNSAIWQQVSAKVLTGDFLGLNRDQLMFINPSNTGVAVSVWAYDAATGRFNEVHKMNYGANEIPAGGFNGFMEADDWLLGF